jgi:hypothetical protein
VSKTLLHRGFREGPVRRGGFRSCFASGKRLVLFVPPC